EALLERKWPQKYNDLGHMRWAGQLYGPGLMRALRFTPSRIYHGPWGSAPFQSLYAPAPGLLAALVQTPEWYVMTALLLLAGGVRAGPDRAGGRWWPANRCGASAGRNRSPGWKRCAATCGRAGATT